MDKTPCTGNEAPETNTGLLVKFESVRMRSNLELLPVMNVKKLLKIAVCSSPLSIYHGNSLPCVDFVEFYFYVFCFCIVIIALFVCRFTASDNPLWYLQSVRTLIGY